MRSVRNAETMFRSAAISTGLALLAAGGIAQAQSPGLDSLRNDILSRIADVPGAQVGVAYADLETGDTLYVNADSIYHAASTMKVPVMMEIFRQASAGSFSLDQQILVINQFSSLADSSHFSVDAGDDSDSSLYLRVGTRVPVRELMRLMIDRSSNLATNVLIALVGPDHVTAMMRQLGARRMTVYRGVQDLKAFDKGLNNTATSRDLSILLRSIEEGAHGILKSSEEMREILLAQEFNDRIPAGLPPGTKVAHKTGDITAHYHDAALVYPPNRKPYVLVLLTRGMRDTKVSAALMADISRMIYAFATTPH